MKNVIRSAEFLGCPFSREDEEEEEEIVRLCSFEKLKEAEGNKKSMVSVVCNCILVFY